VALDKKSVADALRSLVEDDEARTEVAKIKEHLEAIEQALTAGVSRTAIHEKLCQCGLKMTKGSFLNALKKLRKGRNEPAQSAKTKQNKKPQESSEVQEEAKKDQEDEYNGLTRRERGLKVAEKYINDDKLSPHTIRVLEKEKLRKQLMEKNDESNSD
jgi:hypothetical protein